MGYNPGGTRVQATVLFTAEVTNEEFRKLTRADTPPPPPPPPDQQPQSKDGRA